MSCFAISRLLRDPHASLVLLSWCTLKLLPKRLPLNHDCIELRTEEMQEFISWRTFVSLEASSWCNRFERRKTQAVYFMLRYPFLLSYLRGDHDEQDHDHLSCLSSSREETSSSFDYSSSWLAFDSFAELFTIYCYVELKGSERLKWKVWWKGFVTHNSVTNSVGVHWTLQRDDDKEWCLKEY